MNKILVMKCNVYDIINETNWPENWIKSAIQQLGNGYYFDETDKCVYRISYDRSR